MNALSSQEVAALREGDVVLIRMVVRKPLGEYGTVHCRIRDEETWRSHYIPVFPQHIVGIDAGDAELKGIAESVAAKTVRGADRFVEADDVGVGDGRRINCTDAVHSRL
jgi:hypothetical protein